VTADGVGSNERSGSAPAFEAKAAYSWTGDVAGKVWASAISQKVEGLTNAGAAGINSVTGATAAATANTLTDNSDRANAWDIGTNVNVAGFGLTAYYGKGQGILFDEPFVSPSGDRLMFPGDRSLGASADETVQCRCRVEYRVDWIKNDE
jgi:hypothetical protein